MLKIERLEVGQMKANCYIVFDEEEKNALIIDPGDDGDYIIRRIADLEVNPVCIAATHGHFDHILAAEELRLAYGIPFIIHPEDEFIVEYASKSAQHYLGYKDALTPQIDKYFNDNDLLKKFDIEILETPGHTPGSVSLYSHESDIVFVGDLVFSDGNIGRTDFKYSSILNLTGSLNKILALPSATRVFSGHGKPTTIKALRTIIN